MTGQNHLSSIIAKLRTELPTFVDKYHIKKLEVFGSYVRSEQTSDSDLDMLITFSKLPSFLTFIEIENNLSDLLGVKVDLVMKDSLKPSIRKQIIREAIPV